MFDSTFECGKTSSYSKTHNRLIAAAASSFGRMNRAKVVGLTKPGRLLRRPFFCSNGDKDINAVRKDRKVTQVKDKKLAVECSVSDEASTMPEDGYHEEYTCLVVDTMARGLSLTAFAGEIGMSRKEVEAWIVDYPSFASAVERGHAKRVLFFEERLLASAGTQANAPLSILKQVFLQDWAGTSTDVSGEGTEQDLGAGAPISVQRVLVSVKAEEEKSPELETNVANGGGLEGMTAMMGEANEN